MVILAEVYIGEARGQGRALCEGDMGETQAGHMLGVGKKLHYPLHRHGRARPGHPATRAACGEGGWIPGSSPGMTMGKGWGR